jgi:hypothetical protein
MGRGIPIGTQLNREQTIKLVKILKRFGFGTDMTHEAVLPVTALSADELAKIILKVYGLK